MKQLRAEKINWPDWFAYIVDQEEWCPHMFFSKEEFLKIYSLELLNILDTIWEYESPYVDKNQLDIQFPK